MRKAMIASLVLAGLGYGSAASAQQVGADGYRTGLPPVMTPPPTANTFPASGFAAAYRRAGRPRIVVLWNRELSDEVASQYVDRTTGSAATVVGSAAVSGAWSTRYPRGIVGYSEGVAVGATAAEVESTRERVDPGARLPLREADQWEFEQAIVETLGQGGIRLIDRTVVMRTAAGGVTGSAPNVQAIEASALRAKADLVLEILATPDGSAPLGWAFRASARHLRSGEILASVTASAPAAQDGPPRYRATDHGFEPIGTTTTYAGVARSLAQQLMAALAVRWG